MLYAASIPDALIDLIGMLPMEVLVAFAWTQVLSIRRKRLFAVGWIAFSLGASLAGVLGYGTVQLACTVACVVLPLVMAKNRFSVRVLTVALFCSVLVLGNLASSAFWYLSTGQSSFGYEVVRENLGAHVLMQLIEFTLLATMLYGLYALTKRLFKDEEIDSLAYYVGFPATQLVLLVLVFLTQLAVPADAYLYIGTGVLAVFGLAVDALLLWALGRARALRRELQHAELLQEQLDESTVQQQKLVAAVEATSRFRHDMRNQMQVVTDLAQCGEWGQAREFLDSLTETLRTRWAEAVPDEAGFFDADGEQAKAGRPADGQGDGRQDGSGAAPGPEPSVAASRTEPPGGRLLPGVALPVRLGSVLFPLSQAGMVGFLYWHILRYQAPWWMQVVVVAAGALCVAADVALYKGLRAASEKELSAMRSRYRARQEREQAAVLERQAAEAEAARHIRAQIAEELSRIDRLLGQREGEEARAQLRQVSDMLDPPNRRYCAHPAVNALIETKARRCAELGVRLEAHVDVPYQVPLSSAELCAVFGNLLDNALHACELVDEGSRLIVLKSGFSGGYLLVDVENSCLGKRRAHKARRRDDRSADGGKRGSGLARHGWGLKIVSDIAKRNEGFLVIDQGKATFRASVMLHCRQQGGLGGQAGAGGSRQDERAEQGECSR